jgi:predicted membrane protein
MRAIAKLIGLFVGLTFVTALISAISAAILKERLVSRGAELDDEIDLVTIFNGHEFVSKAAAFRGGSVLMWYGGGSVDLREATLDPAGATLQSRTIFGGLQVIVPETWQVRTNITAIIGGVADTRDHSRVIPDGPVLVLNGFALFGGVQVTAEAADQGAPAEVLTPTPA